MPIRIALGTVTGVFTFVIAAVAASQAFASTPKITDANGKPLPGSIAVLEEEKHDSYI